MMASNPNRPNAPYRHVLCLPRIPTCHWTLHTTTAGSAIMDSCRAVTCNALVQCHYTEDPRRKHRTHLVTRMDGRTVARVPRWGPRCVAQPRPALLGTATVRALHLQTMPLLDPPVGRPSKAHRASRIQHPLGVQTQRSQHNDPLGSSFGFEACCQHTFLESQSALGTLMSLIDRLVTLINFAN